MDSVVRTAASLANEAGRLSQMLTTQIVEKTKEVGVPSHLFDTAEERLSDIEPGLNSKFDKEKLDALKRLVALISKGRNVAEFFPHVIKNVSSQSFDVRKLVYIYLLRYAEEEPDLALLSINTFQKDMTDKNPLIRAMALRVMSSIRVPVIVPIITLALRKGVSDLSPYVRKAAANAIPKCFGLDASQKDFLVELIQQLLNDKSTVVLGTAVSTFNRVCPERFDLVHKHFHKLCRLLVDCDEWGQIEILSLMLRYIRAHFVQPGRDFEASTSPIKVSGFFDTPATGSGASLKRSVDPDHALFLRACRPLLMSRNPSVVLKVASMLAYIGPLRELRACAPSVMRLVRYSKENQYAVLLVILSLSKRVPDAFEQYARQFVVFDGDTPHVRNLKLEIMEHIASENNVAFILSEFRAYICSPDQGLCVHTIQVWGRLASRMPSLMEQSLQALAGLISETNATIVGEAIIVLRRLLQVRSSDDTSPASSSARHTSHNALIRRLFDNYTAISVPMAKASVLWLVSHNVATLAKTAPDALRIALQTFASQDPIVKLQILNLAAAIAVTTEQRGESVPAAERRTLRLCFEYALSLAKFDLSVDVRDRARLLEALVFGPVYGNGDAAVNGAAKAGSPAPGSSGRDAVLQRLARLLAGSQGVSKPPDPYEGLSKFTIGTLSHALGAPVDGYEEVLPWATAPSDASLRAVQETSENWNRDRVVASDVKQVRISGSPGSAGGSSSGGGGGRKVKKRVVALDDFLSSPADDAHVLAKLNEIPRSLAMAGVGSGSTGAAPTAAGAGRNAAVAKPGDRMLPPRAPPVRAPAEAAAISSDEDEDEDDSDEDEQTDSDDQDADEDDDDSEDEESEDEDSDEDSARAPNARAGHS
ncbi:AP-3 complex subunit beta [Polyrhizophydium stewartii]|uniref:AP-3 complex subunit beta n=1 Tax=Polyrhizophydium stewartii TaxID=2732419 RepID=A0ABR4N691_9FUNG